MLKSEWFSQEIPNKKSVTDTKKKKNLPSKREKVDFSFFYHRFLASCIHLSRRNVAAIR